MPGATMPLLLMERILTMMCHGARLIGIHLLVRLMGHLLPMVVVVVVLLLLVHGMG